ncbi:hypothetical protein SCHPADRAFT_999056 [Schizopora paradoxa]|uniref:RING-type E3 ubiquitin transferase (cysteine targeting) n=1 Tax=Schizopora paradoxa TaxID=27342 RepID=A0A0H2RP34_9AGAM|nr:hypothetical protein SCHPADRAFT_999056 [Schizopora paradoxa]
MTLPSFWQQAWDEAEPRLREWGELWRNATVDPRVLRVGQLDAELLDEDLVQVLNEPLSKALSMLNSSLKSKLGPELILMIRLTLYKFSLWDVGATYGAKLQDLRYSVPNKKGWKLAPSGLPKWTLGAHAFMTVIIPYLHSRLRNHALAHSWPDAPSHDRKRKAWNLMNTLESLHGTAALFSFVVFLWNGRYRTLADRLLSMRLLPSKRLASRQVSYEFMNRQMVWHAFTEFLLLVLPFFGSRTFRRTYKQLTTGLRNLLPTPEKSSRSGKEVVRKGKYFSLPSDQCAICADNASFNLSSFANDPGHFASGLERSSGQQAEVASEEGGPPNFPITSTYRASCGHEYCYYCLAGRLLRAVDDGDDGWECLRCTALIRSCERVTAVAPSEDIESDDIGSEVGTSSFATDISFDSLSSES